MSEALITSSSAPAKKVPASLKVDIWTFYTHARSGDPRIRIPGTINLISSLIGAARIIDEHEFDGLFQECLLRANESLTIYMSGDWAGASILAGSVANALTGWAYDPLWSSPQEGSFALPASTLQEVK